MSKSLRIVAALVVALLALPSSAPSARTRLVVCAGCATVIDIDPIYYPRDKAPEGAAPGTVIGAKGHWGDKLPVKELIGRDARRGDQGNDAKGLRLELRMDGGGERKLEVTDMRVYRRDRVRIEDNRLVVFD